MSKVTYKAVDVMWVEIQGEFVRRGFTRQDDDNVIGRFMAWMGERRLFSYKTTSSGGGGWYGCFLKEDWPEVQEWLEKNGAVFEKDSRAEEFREYNAEGRK